MRLRTQIKDKYLNLRPLSLLIKSCGCCRRRIPIFHRYRIVCSVLKTVFPRVSGPWPVRLSALGAVLLTWERKQARSQCSTPLLVLPSLCLVLPHLGEGLTPPSSETRDASSHLPFTLNPTRQSWVGFLYYII